MNECINMAKKRKTELKVILINGSLITFFFWVVMLALHFLEFNKVLGFFVLMYLASCLILGLIVFIRLYRKYEIENPNPDFINTRIVGAFFVGIVVFLMVFPLRFLLS